jgi:hypothetical protein
MNDQQSMERPLLVDYLFAAVWLGIAVYMFISFFPNRSAWLLVPLGLLPLPRLYLRQRRWFAAKDKQVGFSKENHTTGRPKVFSQPSMTFDHNPADSELTCLLGENVPYAKEFELSSVLIVRPGLMPIRWIVAVLIFFACVISFFWTPGIHSMGHAESIAQDWVDLFITWFACGFIWLVFVPSTVGVLWFYNRQLSKKGDFFRVDFQRRTLELCQAGRTLKTDDIIAFTELTRWYGPANSDGNWTRQTGVLIRNGPSVEWYPLVPRIWPKQWKKTREPLIDRLACFFQKKVRRIELDRQHSNKLGDSRYE